MAKYAVEFSNKLIEKIQGIIEEGKNKGELLNTIESKSAAMYIVSVLQGATSLWIINPKIDIKKLFKNNFYYLWNSLVVK